MRLLARAAVLGVRTLALLFIHLPVSNRRTAGRIFGAVIKAVVSTVSITAAMAVAGSPLSTIKAAPLAPALTALAPEQQGRLFSMQGSNTVGARLAPELARDYLQAKGVANVTIQPSQVENEYQIVGYHPKSNRAVHIDVAAHGSSTAFAGLAAGTADIGLSSRPITDAEAVQLREQGDMRGFEAEKVVAIDGLAILVHPDNPINELTLEQIAQIFAGEISNWRELGGRPGLITRYARDDRSGTWDTFKSLVLGKRYRLADDAQRFESNDEISRLVQSDRHAIGFVGLASVGGAKALAVSDANTRALMPTLLTVATEDYLLARRLFMYVPPSNQSVLIREFIGYAQSRAGQERVEQVGYVAQNPVALPHVELPNADPAYQAMTEGAQRLSVNIRFRTGSSALDNKARQDILRLSRLMESPEYRNRQLLLIGFGDAKQSESRARVLSRLRAVTVRSALRDYGVQTLPIEGLGDSLPVADNSSGNRTKNQRVEVWLM